MYVRFEHITTWMSSWQLTNNKGYWGNVEIFREIFVPFIFRHHGVAYGELCLFLK